MNLARSQSERGVKDCMPVTALSLWLVSSGFVTCSKCVLLSQDFEMVLLITVLQPAPADWDVLQECVPRHSKDVQLGRRNPSASKAAHCALGPHISAINCNIDLCMSHTAGCPSIRQQTPIIHLCLRMPTPNPAADIACTSSRPVIPWESEHGGSELWRTGQATPGAPDMAVHALHAQREHPGSGGAL